MYPSPQTDLLSENTESKETKRDETEKTIYRNRKANYLSAYKGSEEEGGCS